MTSRMAMMPCVGALESPKGAPESKLAYVVVQRSQHELLSTSDSLELQSPDEFDYFVRRASDSRHAGARRIESDPAPFPRGKLSPDCIPPRRAGSGNPESHVVVPWAVLYPGRQEIITLRPIDRAD
jgi:hypothetical protein